MIMSVLGEGNSVKSTSEYRKICCRNQRKQVKGFFEEDSFETIRARVMQALSSERKFDWRSVPSLARQLHLPESIVSKALASLLRDEEVRVPVDASPAELSQFRSAALPLTRGERARMLLGEIGRYPVSGVPADAR